MNSYAGAAGALAAAARVLLDELDEPDPLLAVVDAARRLARPVRNEAGPVFNEAGEVFDEALAPGNEAASKVVLVLFRLPETCLSGVAEYVVPLILA